MAKHTETSSIELAAIDWPAGDFLPGRTAMQPAAPAPDPLPWEPISRAQCWLLALELHRTWAAATRAEVER
jgi:hypothetical protein